MIMNTKKYIKMKRDKSFYAAKAALKQNFLRNGELKKSTHIVSFLENQLTLTKARGKHIKYRQYILEKLIEERPKTRNELLEISLRNIPYPNRKEMCLIEMRNYAKTELNTKEKALHFLYKAGIYTKKGKLRKKYCG